MVKYWLLLTLVLMLLLCYFMFKKDILAPPFVACSGFVFSVLCYMYNMDYLAIDLDLHWITYAVIIGGLGVFIFFAFLIYALFDVLNAKRASRYHVGLHEISQQPQPLQLIKIYPLNLLIFLVLSIIILLLYYTEVMRIAMSYGGGRTWTELMNTYRVASSYGILAADEKITPLIRWSFHAILIGGMVSLYVLINNFLAGGKVQFALVLVVLLSIISSFLTSGRVELIRFFAIGLIVYYVLWRRKFGWQHKIDMKYWLISLMVVAVAFAAFVNTRGMVGRMTTMDSIYYLTYYAGWPIQLLDMYLQAQLSAHRLWGYETFYGFNRFIGDWFNIPEYRYLVHKEFRQVYGLNVGNVYTAFRSYIQDFGYTGMIILTGIFSSFFAAYYNILRCKSFIQPAKQETPKIDLALLIYAYIFLPVVLMFFADSFYSTILSPGTIKNLFILWLMDCCFTRVRIVSSSDWNNRCTQAGTSVKKVYVK